MNVRLAEQGYPFIARIAGLPAEALAPFGGELCRRRAAEIGRLNGELRQARHDLVQVLHAAIEGAPRERRQLLLAAKRDSFNGRSLRAHRKGEAWPLLVEAAGSLAGRMIELEEAIEAAEKLFADVYERQRRSERLHLARLAADPGLRRGMALGSLVLLEQLPRLSRTPPEAFGRRERRLEQALLRYASRAALKLSPFSSLTRLALGEARRDTASFKLLDAGRWNERSMICLRRQLIERVTDLLAGYPPFRNGLPVVLNDSIERLEGGLYRFLQPGRWEADVLRGELVKSKPGMVQVRLAGPLIDWLERRLPGPPLLQGELLAEAREALGGRVETELAGKLDELFRIGFLGLRLPWASGDLELERTVLSHLASLPPDPLLAPAIGALSDLVSLFAEFPRSRQPAAVVARAREATGLLIGSAVRLAGVAEPLRTEIEDHSFLEDVLLLPEEERPGFPEVVRVPWEEARRVLRLVEPLVRLSNLDSSRHDFLATLGAFAARRWPGASEVGFLDLFNAVRPLFREYLAYEAGTRGTRALAAPGFNPLDLPEVERLHGHRQGVLRGLDGCLRSTQDELVLSRRRLTALLDGIPGPYAAARDFCAFLQPLSRRHASWVVNHVFEGAGRLSSRYTSLMDEPARRHWTRYFTERSVFLDGGEPAELVDLFCPSGNVINLHAPQTERVIEIPGEPCPLPAERRLNLRDLRVRFGEAGSSPWLVDPGGRRLLPVHLGGIVFRFIPHLLKFLVLLGLGEFRYCIPRRGSYRIEDTRIFPRHRIGDVVFSRKTWIFEPETVQDGLKGLSSRDAFLRIGEWREDRGIPDCAFVVEPLERGVPGGRKKPQFIDFTSPSFMELFRSIVSQHAGPLELTEALPSPGEMPRGGDGQGWAVELQLDSFGLLSWGLPEITRLLPSDPRRGEPQPTAFRGQ